MTLHDWGGVLLRLRTHPIVILANVEKAFLLIQLQEEERNVRNSPLFLLISRRAIETLDYAHQVDYCDDPDFQIGKESVTKLLETWKKGRKLSKLFRKIWKDEDVLSVRERIPLFYKQPKTSHLGEPKKVIL